MVGEGDVGVLLRMGVIVGEDGVGVVLDEGVAWE